VAAAEYSDRAAADYLTDVIIARRDKIGLVWLTAINPIADLVLDADGVLTFRNLAVETRRATPPQGYDVQWARFDNSTGTAVTAGPRRTLDAPRDTLPAPLREAAFVQAEIRTTHAGFPAWAAPVTAHFRRIAGGWQLVGLRRALPTS
jgi:hypothetical protein